MGVVGVFMCIRYRFSVFVLLLLFFFFQAEDGIRDAQESRGLGDVYKRQPRHCVTNQRACPGISWLLLAEVVAVVTNRPIWDLSLIHI